MPNLVEGELPLEGAEIEEVRTTYLSYYLLLTVNCSLLTPFVSTRVLTTYYSPPTTHHPPLTTHHSPLTTHHSPLTTYYVMPKERRLAYVALSRAKTNLYVSHAARDASGQPTTASRFLRELPAEMIASEMAYDEPRA